MAERWSSSDVKRLLMNKHVVIIGDSIQRGFYKDLVCLLQSDQYVERSVLRSKGTKTCQDDELVEGGHFGEMHNGKNYREVRHYQTGHHMVSYYMVTSCYSDYVETILEDMMIWDHKPDVVTMASCVWDMTRYGPKSWSKYQYNLQRLAKRLKLALGEDTLFIWNTATPVSRQVRGGFMLQEISFRNETLRYDIVEANFYATQVMVDHGFDVLDLHYHFRHFIHLREQDGIHWNAIGHRKMSNLILDHIATALKFPLPRNMWSNYSNNMSNRVPRQGDRRVHQRANTWNNGGLLYANNNNCQNNNMFCNNNNAVFNNSGPFNLGGLLNNENIHPLEVKRMADHYMNLAAMLQERLSQNIPNQFQLPYGNNFYAGPAHNVLRPRNQNRFQPY